MPSASDGGSVPRCFDARLVGGKPCEPHPQRTTPAHAGLPLVPAHGGWSALFDATACGLEPLELSARLLDQKVAATPMTDAWGGPEATRYLRLVFSNEPVERLAMLGDRLRAALG